MNRSHLENRATLAGLFVFVCGIAAFARSIAFDFVYDDHWTVEGAPNMRLGRLLSLLARGAGRDLHIPDQTRPSMVLSVWLDRALFGARPAGYHADSLLLYGVVCALATWVILALTGRLRLAAVGGLLFAVAPLHAEVVCAINYREDLLAAIGVLVPMLYLTRPTTRPSQNAWIAIACCWAVGLFAKESAVVLVPLLAATMILPRARARLLARRRLLVGLSLVLVVWGVWRAVLFTRGDDVPRAHYGGVGLQLVATARFVVREAAATLLPFHAAPEHARQGPASAWWILALAAWTALIGALARRRATRVPALGLAIASIAPLAASPLVGPANEIADRYLFLGVFGAGLVWGWLACRTPSRVATIAVAAGVVGLWFVCQSAASPWRSDRALWSAAIECAPTSPRAWVGLSRAARIDGDLAEADRAVDRAIALDPKFATAHVTRAYNLLWRGDVEGAKSELAIVHELGGDHQRGVAKATECAALPAERAMACVR